MKFILNNNFPISDDLELVSSKLKYFIAQKEYDAYIELTINTTILYLVDETAFEFLIQILLNALETETNFIHKKSIRARLLNALANLCKAHGYQQYAINLYFVSYLYLDKHLRFKYYNNVANTLSQLKDDETAVFYYNLSIENLLEADSSIIGEDFKNYHFFLLNLNLILSLLYLNRIDEAKKVFDNINFSSLKDRNYNNYDYVKALFDFYSSSTKNIKVFYKLKQTYISSKSHKFVIIINNFLLENDPNLTNKDIENLFLENYQLSKKTIDKKLQRSIIVSIIQFYKSNKMSKKMNNFLLLLFEFDTTPKHNLSSFFSNIYLKEISKVFNDLTLVNNKLSEKKTELENITHILSHDLKTPVRTINSFSKLLERDISRKQYSSIIEHVSFITKASEHLYKLIEDVGLLKKLDRSVDERIPIDLNKVAQAVKINLDYLVYKKSASITINNTLPVIEANYASISIIFQNLVENGLKYNESKNPFVDISSETNSEYLLIHFKDNGIGIDSEFFEQIFKLFKRLHNEEKYQGTGFGLGICKRIIIAYGGDIYVKSSPNKGSTFTIQLPIEMLAL